METPAILIHEKYISQVKTLAFLNSPDELSFAASILTYSLFNNGDILLRIMPIIDKTKNFVFDIQFRLRDFDGEATAMHKPLIDAMAFRPVPPKNFDPDELNFSRFVNSVFGTSYPLAKMSDTLFFNTACLDDHYPQLDSLLKRKVHFKLFPEKGNYFEMFLNVDFPAKVIEVVEKDPEYRGALYKFLFR